MISIRKMIKYGVLMSTLPFLTGCATTLGTSKKEPIKKKIIFVNKDKPYKFNYVPIIGTQTPDDKVLINMGVVLRIWIHSYKTRDNNLVASHDIYIWGKKPDFIVGNPLPTINRGILTPQGKMPFMLSDSSVDRSNFKSNLNIRNFVNSVYEKQDKTKTVKRVNESKKFDEAIKNFLKNNTHRSEK